jgi:tRNA pseudouridine(55) synthase
MKKRIVIEKEVGETPLAAITKWKRMHPEYADVSASYAGRLDPMARGKLLVLLGDECKQQKRYTSLDKEYEIEILLDAGSDTGDALGLVQYSYKETTVEGKKLQSVLRKEQGAHSRPYPHFSSKTVNGKPLFLHTLEGTVSQIDIPEHDECIYKIRVQDIKHLSSKALGHYIEDFLKKVPKTNEPSKQLGADFRIDEVRKSWQNIFTEAGERTFTIVSLRVSCGSGTYMRALAARIGKELGTDALALSINRTKIGKYWNGWWLKRF